MKTSVIEAKIFFRASPIEVYELLMDSHLHAELTESPAKISRRVDGFFRIFDGYCHGYNIELVEGKKIVQAWHFDEEDWPESHFTICQFEFEPAEGGCTMTFKQTEVPDFSEKALRKGWQKFYWEPMQAYFLQ